MAAMKGQSTGLVVAEVNTMHELTMNRQLQQAHRTIKGFGLALILSIALDGLLGLAGWALWQLSR